MPTPKRWSAPSGSPRISTTRMSGCSTARSSSRASPRPRAQDYDAGHIPGAVFFDIDDVAEPGTSLPHMIPSAERFAAKMAERGIGNDDRVVVYDANGLSSAGRAWWMLRLFGHDNVALLDGGLPKWKREGRPLETASPKIPPRAFTARFNPAMVRDKAGIVANLASAAELVVDARSRRPFRRKRRGDLARPPPRPHSRQPQRAVRPGDRPARPSSSKARRRCARSSPRPACRSTRAIVTSCGSGVTACAVAFALHLIGHPGAAVYDGSWSEWGLPDGPPIATGPA